uniref:Magnesium transporter n=1 Tax=Haptolina brevifila TaxID=156173 RepID=A0A7S2IND5_9EUKA
MTAIEAEAAREASQMIYLLSQNLWWVGILFDAVATLAGTIGKQMLRKAVTSKNCMYYPLGLVLTAGIDPAFDLVAYSFAAQSIIAACAGLVVVWNVILAPCSLGEKLTPSRKVGAAIICIGTILVGVFGSHTDIQRTPDEYLELFVSSQACIYYACFSCWLVLCMVMRRCASLVVGAGFLCAMGGSLAGNSFTTKAAVELTECGALDPGCTGSPFTSPLFYLFAGASLFNATISLYILAITLREFEALFMITVYQGFFILSGALSGNLVMDEKAGRSWRVLSAYCASIGLVIIGLAILCHGEWTMRVQKERARSMH